LILYNITDLHRFLQIFKDEERVSREAGLSVPQKIDENMWKNREHIEEMLFLLEESHWPKLLQQKATDEDSAIVSNFRIKLQSTFKALESFQIRNTDNVFSTVMTYMPQDFRGSLIRQQRERSERSRQAVVDALINSGGSIHDKYALMWTQQMDRRSQLAQLGSATGVYKALVKYLVGVPQVLLDFVRQINDDHGPMEEQRQRYGPSFYRLTKLAIYIRLCLLLSWGRCKTNKIEKDQMTILEHAINVYTLELERFLNFIGDVFANSPFLISADEAGALESSESKDYKETIIPAGKKHEVSLTIDTVNSYIAWDFSLTQGKNMDIGFTLEHVSASGQVSMILPYQRYESDQGNFSTIVTGCYKLTWDNSYSKFYKKNLRYKVDAIPPVAEIVEPVTEDV